MISKISNFKQKQLLPYLLLMPALVLLSALIIYPIIRGIQISFFKSTIVDPYGSFKFAGFSQYLKALSLTNATFWGSLWHSIVWTILSVVFSFLIGLGLAILLNGNIKGRGILRALILIPWVIPSIVAAAQWKVMFASFGFINNFLHFLKIISDPVLFLANPKLALFSVAVVNIWRSYPFMTVVLLAGLQSIPDELYEAGYVDGTTVWQKFWHITMPLLRPVSMISLMLLSIWSFNNFDLVFLITSGGPVGSTEVLPTYVYLEAFKRLNPGYAAAIATIMLVFLTLIIYLFMRVYRRNVEI